LVTLTYLDTSAASCDIRNARVFFASLNDFEGLIAHLMIKTNLNIA